ncbi:hypothetical protein GCM10023116_33720 [Kistimonas scapharcae]|uniref:Ankyrin n=1 Tax=Kistimonas scapharcae TaxID=1036133 RepID=A0ABP8V6P7_9GAMM
MKQPEKTGQASLPSISTSGEPLLPVTAVSQGRTLQRTDPSIPILVKTYPRDIPQETKRYRCFLPTEDSRFQPDINGETPLTRALYEHIEDKTHQRIDTIRQNINVAMLDLFTLHQKNPVAAQVVVNQADDEGDTALVYASTFGMADLFEPLFKLGANPGIETKRRSLFLLFNTQNKLPGVSLATSALTYLYAMKKHCQFDIASELNRMKVTKSQYSDSQYDSILHKAMICSPPIDGIGHVINQLLEYDADPNQINTKGQIPLYLAEHLPKEEPDYHCGSASLRSLAGMGQVRAAM